MTGLAAGGGLLLAAAAGWPAAAAVALGGLALLIASPPAARGSRLLPVLLVVSAAGVGALRAAPPPPGEALDWVDSAAAVRGYVETTPDRTGRSQRFTLRVTEFEADSRWDDASGRLCVTVLRPRPAIGQGDRVWLPGEAEAATDVSERGRELLAVRGCGAAWLAPTVAIDAAGGGWARPFADARDRFGTVLAEIAPGDAGALMGGLVTGADETLLAEARAAFRSTNASHVTAVSGANFATLLVALVVAGRWTGWRRRAAWMAVVVTAIWAYALFVGLEPPAVRAALVATGATLALRVGRRPDVVTLIAVAAGAMVAVAPGLVWSLSFQLSLVASLAIAGTVELAAGRGPGSAIGAALAATVVAQIATLPLLLPIAGQFSAAGLPANLAIAPLVAVAFPLSAMAGLLALVWLPLGEVVAVPATLTTTATVAAVEWFARLGPTTTVGDVAPWARLFLAAAAVAACAMVSRDGQRFWRRRERWWQGLAPGERSLAWGALLGLVVGSAVALAFRR